MSRKSTAAGCVELDPIAELLQLDDQPAGLPGRVDAGQEVQRAKVAVTRTVVDDVPRGDELAVPDRTSARFLPRLSASRRYCA